MLHKGIHNGGIVVEACEIAERPLTIYIECRHVHKHVPAGLFVNKTIVTEKIEIGDLVEWRSLSAYWTPADIAFMSPDMNIEFLQQCGLREGKDYRVRVQMQDLVGVEYPNRPTGTNKVRPLPWVVQFACNDELTGKQRDTVDAVELGCCGTSIDDSHDRLMLRGTPLQFRWVPSGFLLSANRFDCRGIQTHVGNWCWDGAFVSDTHALRLQQLLKSRGWQCEESSSPRLAEFWGQLQ